jgi:hypothetical protein|tara:strand:+ start:1541 stop:2071 length:531 start_codon:yes stop_codon:yes gene_type:complete
MAYAKVVDNNVTAYPYGMKNLRSDNPNTSFPKDSLSNADIREQYGIYNVVESEVAPPSGHKAIEGMPTFSNGVCTKDWEFILKDPTEVTEGEKVGEVYEHRGVVYPGHEGQRATEVLPVWDGNQWNREYQWDNISYHESRLDAYGPVHEQLEHIAENGLESWQTKVAEVKTRYPKS